MIFNIITLAINNFNNGIINIATLGEAGLSLVGLMIIEYLLLWTFTDELLNRESFFIFLNIIFTTFWSLLITPFISSLYTMFENSYMLYPMLYNDIFLMFFIVSIILLIVPIFMFIRKYLKLKKLEELHSNIYGDYDSLTNKETGDFIKIIKEIKEYRKKMVNLNKQIKKATDLHNRIYKNPNLLVNGLNDKPNGFSFITNNINIFVGLGGTGISLLDHFMDYCISQGIFDGNTGNEKKFLFVAFDSNRNDIQSLIKKYSGTPIIERGMLYAFDNLPSPQDVYISSPFLPRENYEAAGGYRALGFGIYKASKDQLLSVIADLVSQRGGANSNIVVIIMNALGGGTGSGSFIHFAKDIKMKLQEAHFSTPQIYGFGIVPKRSEGAETKFHVNAYAAIKELEFIFSHSELNTHDYGDVRNYIQPFNAYFLISRENAYQKFDEEIKSGLSKFLLDFVTVRTAQPIANQNMQIEAHANAPDLEDISHVATRDSFSTITRYEIYYPASRLTWYLNVGLANVHNFEEELRKIKVYLDPPINNNIQENVNIQINNYERKVNKFVKDVENFERERSNFVGKSYKKWKKTLTETWTDVRKLEKDLKEDIYSKSRIEEQLRFLKEKLEENELKQLLEKTKEEEEKLRENNNEKLNENQEEEFETIDERSLELNLYNFKDIIKNEQEFLRNPMTTIIEYPFSVKEMNDEQFTKLILTGEPATKQVKEILPDYNRAKNILSIINDKLFIENNPVCMKDIMEESKRNSEYIDALHYLQKAPNQKGITMVNLDYTKINQTIRPLNAEELDFISQFNQSIVENKIIHTPKIKNIMHVLTTNRRNIDEQEYLSEEAIRNAYFSIANSFQIRPDYKEFRRFDINEYDLIFGLYIYRPTLEEDETPILNDLTFLEESYNNFKNRYLGNPNQNQDLFYCHSLFYNEYNNERLINMINGYLGIRDNQNLEFNQAIQRIFEFWLNYEPSIEKIDVWGTLTLAKFYGLIKELDDNVERLNNEIKNAIEVMEKGGTLNFIEIDRLIHLLNNLALPLSLSSNEKILEIRNQMQKITRNELYEKIQKELSKIDQSIHDLSEKIGQVNDEYNKNLEKLKLKITEYKNQNDVDMARNTQRLVDDIINALRFNSNIENRLRS